MSHKRRYPFYAMCIENKGNQFSLLLGKVYKVIHPAKFDQESDFRVIDEDGEDYLYPASRFVPIELPPKAKKIINASPSLTLSV